ncbi:hypothetical protein OC835_006375 [Tilletia horrida]|nr:hypothetical protein OC835_006375 [Tilletia horrida]
MARQNRHSPIQDRQSIMFGEIEVDLSPSGFNTTGTQTAGGSTVAAASPKVTQSIADVPQDPKDAVKGKDTKTTTILTRDEEPSPSQLTQGSSATGTAQVTQSTTAVPQANKKPIKGKDTKTTTILTHDEEPSPSQLTQGSSATGTAQVIQSTTAVPQANKKPVKGKDTKTTTILTRDEEPSPSRLTQGSSATGTAQVTQSTTAVPQANKKPIKGKDTKTTTVAGQESTSLSQMTRITPPTAASATTIEGLKATAGPHQGAMASANEGTAGVSEANAAAITSHKSPQKGPATRTSPSGPPNANNHTNATDPPGGKRPPAPKQDKAKEAKPGSSASGAASDAGIPGNSSVARSLAPPGAQATLTIVAAPEGNVTGTTETSAMQGQLSRTAQVLPRTFAEVAQTMHANPASNASLGRHSSPDWYRAARGLANMATYSHQVARDQGLSPMQDARVLRDLAEGAAEAVAAVDAGRQPPEFAPSAGFPPQLLALAPRAGANTDVVMSETPASTGPAGREGGTERPGLPLVMDDQESPANMFIHEDGSRRVTQVQGATTRIFVLPADTLKSNLLWSVPSASPFISTILGRDYDSLLADPPSAANFDVEDEDGLEGPFLNASNLPDAPSALSATPATVAHAGNPDPGPGRHYLRCKYCAQIFKNKKDRRRHTVTNHVAVAAEVEVAGWSDAVDIPREKSGPHEGKFPCPKCHRGYLTTSSLRKHTRGCEEQVVDPRIAERETTAAPTVNLDLINSVDPVVSKLTTTNYTPPPVTQRTRWAQRTRFMEILEGQNLRKYQNLLQLPDGKDGTDEPEVRAAVEAVQVAIEQAAEELARCPVFYAQLLNSQDAEQCHNARPMNAKPATLKAYARTMAKLMAFLVRISLIVEEARDGSVGSSAATAGSSQASSTSSNTSIWARVDNEIATAMRIYVEGDISFSALIHGFATSGQPSFVAVIGDHLLTDPLADDLKASWLPILMSALAIEDSGTGTFKSAANFTPEISKILYCFRLCFLVHRRSEIRASHSNGAGHETPEAKRRRERAEADEFAELYDSLLGRKSRFNTGSRYLLATRSYGRVCTKIEGGPARSRWNEDQTELQLDGNQYSLKKLKKMMQNSVEAVQAKFGKLLQRVPVVNVEDSEINVSNLVDNPAVPDAYAWFGTMPGNADKLKIKEYADQVLPQLVHANKAPDGTVMLSYDWPAIERFWAEETEFLKALLAAIHLTSGMPSRGAELLEATYKNIPGGRFRSIFVGFGGEVYLDLTYSKTEYASKKPGQNIHVLLPEIGHILIQYLCGPRQMSDALFMRRHGVQRPYLWCESKPDAPHGIVKWDTVVLTRELRYQAVLAFLEGDFNTAICRHVFEAVAHNWMRTGSLKEFMRRYFGTQEPGDEDDFILLGNSPTSEELDEFILNVEKRVADTFIDAASTSMADGAADGFSAQSGRSLETSWSAYARDITMRGGMTEDVLTTGRLVSRTIQSFFGLLKNDHRRRQATDRATQGPPPAQAAGNHAGQTRGPALAPASLQSHPAGPSAPAARQDHSAGASTAAAPEVVPPSAPEERAVRNATLAHHDRLPFSARLPATNYFAGLILRLMSNMPTFRGLQSHAIADGLQIMEKDAANLVLIAKTGAGKALVWMVSALASRNTRRGFTVLIVPYNALIADIVRKCEQRGIRYHVWDGDSVSTAARRDFEVLIISLNRAVSSPFIEWVATPETKERVVRVIMDEAQVLFDEAFRQSIEDVGRLTSILDTRRFVFLSATVPPAAQADLQRIVLLPLTFARDLTYRTNLAYIIRRAINAREALESIRAELLNVFRPGCAPDAQALIICRSQGDAINIANYFKCGVFFSAEKVRPDGTVVEPTLMAQALEAFLLGNTRLLVGTTAVGAGIDRPNIKRVIFYGEPYSLCSFAQGGGRAGRNGDRAEVIIYLTGTKTKRRGPNGPIPRSDEQALAQLLTTKGCLRVPLSAWIDGRAATCLEIGGERCSGCLHEFGPFTTGDDDEDGGSVDGGDSNEEDWDDEDFDDGSDAPDAGGPSAPQGQDGFSRSAGGQKRRREDPDDERQSRNMRGPTATHEQRESGALPTQRTRDVTGHYFTTDSFQSRDQEPIMAVLQHAEPASPGRTSDRTLNAAPKGTQTTGLAAPLSQQALTQAAEAQTTPLRVANRPPPGLRAQGCMVTGTQRPYPQSPSALRSVEQEQRDKIGTNCRKSSVHANAADSSTQSWPMDTDESDQYEGDDEHCGPSQDTKRTPDAMNRREDEETIRAFQEIDRHAAARERHWSAAGVGMGPMRLAKKTKSKAREEAANPYKVHGVKKRVSRQSGTASKSVGAFRRALQELQPVAQHTAAHGQTYDSTFAPASGLVHTLQPAFVSASTVLLASQCPTLPTSRAEVLAEFATYRRAVQEALIKTGTKCPMCFMLSRPYEHLSSHCQALNLNHHAQKAFREDAENVWEHKQACFYCNMPQSICQRENAAKTCAFRAYRDAVRGILMMLTCYEHVYDAAMDTARLVNPAFALGYPAGPLRMGRHWREPVLFNTKPVYRAFQAVGAVLLTFGETN